MSEFATAAFALELFCFTLIRYPLLCGAGLCTFAAGIWIRAEYFEENARLIRNTVQQTLPDAVDSLRNEIIGSGDRNSTSFIVTRGVVVPAQPSVISVDGPSGGSAVFLHLLVSTTELANGLFGLVDNEATVRREEQLVCNQLPQ